MRHARHQKILEIIQSHDVDTQQLLVDLLQQAGFAVTQATVSRDINDLRLAKTTSKAGKNIYTLPVRIGSPLEDRFKKILRETVLHIDSAENLIVIKTLSGCANAAGEAIDTSDYPEIVGTLAGDNTLVVIVDRKEHVARVVAAFESIIK
ncbi:MAG: arginine repressor [Anaerovoracaceae bacterium]